MQKQTLKAIGTISMLLFLISASTVYSFIFLNVWALCYYKAGVFKR